MFTILNSNIKTEVVHLYYDRTCPHIVDTVSKEEDVNDYKIYHGVLCCPKCLKKINAMSGSSSYAPVNNLFDLPVGYHIVDEHNL